MTLIEVPTKQATFSPKQAELVGEWFNDWVGYYTDGGVCEPENLHTSDMTLEQALTEQAHAARFQWDGRTLTYVPGSSLLADICYQLEDIINDVYPSTAAKRVAGGALEKLEADNTF